jgi:TRAP-type C4-dicarboxylate transport system permease small subunit
MAPRILGILTARLHDFGTLVVMPVLVVLVTTDVVLRYVLNAPLLWGAEVSALLLLVVFFAALPECTASGGHIRMELIRNRLGRGGRRLADALAGVAGFAVSALLTYQAFASTAEMVKYGERAEMIDLPFWPFTAFMGLCAAAMALRFAAGFLAALVGREKA